MLYLRWLYPLKTYSPLDCGSSGSVALFSEIEGFAEFGILFFLFMHFY